MNKSSIREIVRKEKEIHAGFAAVPQIAKIMATVSDRCLVKMEKVLNLNNFVTCITVFAIIVLFYY